MLTSILQKNLNVMQYDSVLVAALCCVDDKT